MNKKLLVFGATLLVGAFALSSCGGDSGDETDEAGDIGTVEGDTGNAVTEDEHVVDHRLPTPTVFFEVIAKIGGDARVDLVNPISNIEDYNTETTQALNFGVYFADLAYMMNYGANANTLQYFEGLQKLATKMSIEAIFSEEMLSQMSDNSEDDSAMYKYSNDVYRQAYSYLEEEEKGDVLALMLVGGWIESMYVVTNLVDEYSENNEIIDEIAGQHGILESIFEYTVAAAETNDDLHVWSEKLYDLYDFYQANIQNNVTSAEKDESGKILLSGGDKVVLDELAFGTIVEKIGEMRSMIVDAD